MAGINFQEEFDLGVAGIFGDTPVCRVAREACRLLESRLGLKIDPSTLRYRNGIVVGKVVFRSTVAGFAVERQFTLRVMSRGPIGVRVQWISGPQLPWHDMVACVIAEIFHKAGFSLRKATFSEMDPVSKIRRNKIFLEIFICGSILDEEDVQNEEGVQWGMTQAFLSIGPA